VTTLYINRSDSVCGACGLTALPGDIRHETPCGWDQHPGCGAEFTAVSSHYGDHSGGMYTRIREMRPDLPFLDPLTGEQTEPTS
jgi:hypothetical protein